MKNGLIVSILLLTCARVVFADEASDYLKDAREYLSRNEPRAAIIQLKNFVKVSPYDGEGRLLLGTTYLELGDVSSAVVQLEKAREFGATTDWAIPLLEAYIASGQPAKVVSTAASVSGLENRKQAEVGALAGLAHLMLQQNEKAEEAFNQALKLDPDSQSGLLGKAKLAIQASEPEKASAIATEVLKKNPENIEAWLILAELERTSANYSEAIEAYNKVLAIRQGNLQAYLGRATVYLMMGELDNAEKDIATVRETAGDFPMVLYLQGALLFERKSYQDAENTLKQLLSLVPDHIPSHLLLGTIAYFQGEFESAYIYLSRYLKDAPPNLAASKLFAATAMKLNHLDEAIQTLESIRDQGQKDSQFLALLGTAYLQDKRYDEGTAILEEAVRLAPDVAAIRAQLAIGHLASGQTDQAVGELTSAVDLGQDLIQADIMLILALIQQNKLDEAVSQGQAMVKRLPGNPVARNLLGAAYLARGEPELARKAWLKALEIQPGYLSAMANLAKLDVKMGDSAAAEKWYEEILQKDPDNLAAMMGLARLAEVAGERESSVDWLNKAAKAHPDNAEPVLVLSRLYLVDGNLEQATLTLAPLLEKFPENAAILRTHGLVQLAAGEHASAISTFYELIGLDESSFEARHLLARALFTSGEFDKARLQWEKALMLNPGFLPASASLARLAISQDEFGEGLRLAREIQSSHPKSSVGFQLEGDALSGMKKYAEAARAYRKGFEIKPSAALVRGLFKSLNLAGDTGAANDTMEAWLKQHPDDLESTILLAMAYQQSGDRVKAIETYENARKIRADHVVVLNNLAWLYQEAGDNRAVETAEAALSASSDSPEVTDTVGWILMQNGQESRSVVLLQQAALNAPHIPAIRVHLAQAFIKLGREAEARKELERVLAEHSDFPEREQATEMLGRL